MCVSYVCISCVYLTHDMEHLYDNDMIHIYIYICVLYVYLICNSYMYPICTHVYVVGIMIVMKEHSNN